MRRFPNNVSSFGMAVIESVLPTMLHASHAVRSKKPAGVPWRFHPKDKKESNRLTTQLDQNSMLPVEGCVSVSMCV